MIWPLDWMIYKTESGSAVKAHGSKLTRLRWA
jgi:hypothetical protein